MTLSVSFRTMLVYQKFDCLTSILYHLFLVIFSKETAPGNSLADTHNQLHFLPNGLEVESVIPGISLRRMINWNWLQQHWIQNTYEYRWLLHNSLAQWNQIANPPFEPTNNIISTTILSNRGKSLSDYLIMPSKCQTTGFLSSSSNPTFYTLMKQITNNTTNRKHILVPIIIFYCFEQYTSKYSSQSSVLSIE